MRHPATVGARTCPLSNSPMPKGASMSDLTPDGKHLWNPQDLSRWDWRRKLGEPGKYPFTRGIYREMYRSRLWTMRQYAGFGSADETNRRFRYLLENGQTGLSVAFDLPTQMGYD